jgi:galactokinase
VTSTEPAAARIAATLGDSASARWFRAPGRVNVVGDHTDYNEGFVLPLAIDRHCLVAARPASTVRVHSLDTAGAVDLPADGSADPAEIEPPWGRLVAAVVRELARLGRPAVGMDAIVASDVPLGAGLSSSAAFEVACATALASLAGWESSPRELALACRDAEESATGVPCGIMDQLASVCGRRNAALLIDCRSLDVRPVPLPEQLALLVVHSGIPRTLGASAYADRRRACEHLARTLGLTALRDATASDVAGEPLGRHVVSENARVLGAAQALGEEDLGALGRLLVESHASLRDDFEVSTPELDVLVEELLAAGALGARLTGAGFGGCVVAACESGSEEAVAAAVIARYRRRTDLAARAFVGRAVDGAAPVGDPS